MTRFSNVRINKPTERIWWAVYLEVDGIRKECIEKYQDEDEADSCITECVAEDEAADIHNRTYVKEMEIEEIEIDPFDAIEDYYETYEKD